MARRQFVVARGCRFRLLVLSCDRPVPHLPALMWVHPSSSSPSSSVVLAAVETFFRVERVVIAGLDGEPSSVTLSRGGSGTGTALGFSYDPGRKVAIVRKPDVPVCDDFDMTLTFVRTS